MTAGAYSIAEVQRLVATLVASKPGGRIAEIGTSYGDGAQAIAGALQGGASFVTVELDPERAAHARAALAGTVAEVLEGDWRELLPNAARSTSCSPTVASPTSSLQTCSPRAGSWSRTT